MNIKRQHKRLKFFQAGMNITELLIAMGLGITLMAGVIEVFAGMRQTERAQESISRLQESGRFALNFLAQNIRSSGYLGCSSTIDQSLVNNRFASIPASFQPITGIQGWEADGTDPGDINNSVADVAVTSVTNGNANWDTTGGNNLDTTSMVPDSDILKVWSVDTADAGVLISVTPGVTPILNVTNMNIAVGDVLLISDCLSADIVQPCVVTNVAGPPATLNLSLSTACSPGNTPSSLLSVGPGADVYKLEGTMYYIGKRSNTATNPPALYRRTLGNTAVGGTPEELVEGVENMQLLFGENTNNDSRNAADRYVPADVVTDWTNVVSVRITFLLQSIGNNLTPSPQPYTFNGVIYDGESGNGDLPPDNKLRRVFSSTISLRNRTLGG